MWQYSGRDYFPTDWHFLHLGRLAVGGAGLVMQEGTAVERRGGGCVADIGIWDDRFIAPLRRITDFVKSFGASPGIQLPHCGRRAARFLSRAPREIIRGPALHLSDRHRGLKRDQRIAPAARSLAISTPDTPQSASAASVCSPGVGGPERISGRVRLKRGAGPGCLMPSIVT